VPLKYDVSEDTDEDRAHQEKWNARTLPAVIFLDVDGNELARVSEYQPPARFLKTLEPAVQRLRGQATAAAKARK
jgi:thioredoxin-related protein